MQVPATHRRAQFGPFTVDLILHELHKDGCKVNLQEKPFQILALLLERPGELVTREELRTQLWPADTFVDFGHSINVAIRKLREALEDDAEAPRFIETLAKHGYRFIATVEEVASVDEAIDRRPAASELPATRLRRLWYVPAAAGVLGLVALALALNLGGVRDRIFHKSELPPHIQSLAVLPLENLSQDPNQEYFADGLTDALITDLGKVGTLRLISRTSVLRYKRTNKSLPEIARELGVDGVVEGTVMRSGSQVRVTVQLIQAPSDRHLWAERYERDEAETVQLERQLALAIAHEVSGQLTPAQEMRVAGGKSTNPRAYDAYLHGRYLWGQRTAEGENGARAYFEQALQDDPGFALAYSGLADYYSVSWEVPGVDASLGEKYARKAVALDPDLAEAHASLGIAEVYQHKFVDAEKELRKAIQLNPNYAMAHHWYGLYLLVMGRNAEALAENDRARQLDPFSLPINILRGTMLIGLHDYDRAVEQIQTAIAINPQSSPPHYLMARLDWILGRVPEALEEARATATLAHDSVLLHDQDEIAAAYARSGLQAAKLRAAKLSEEHYENIQPGSEPPDGHYIAYEVALRYAVLKDKKKTLELLDQAVRPPFDGGFTEEFASAPEFEFLRSDPRFRELRRRFGLPPD
jgi:TolB-like protein/DNA-binding winged helix-turn-helix (wHTH) protein/Tfp pilus assembly protein PilF